MVFPKAFLDRKFDRTVIQKAHTPFFFFCFSPEKHPWTKLPPTCRRWPNWSALTNRRSDSSSSSEASEMEVGNPWLPWWVGGIFLFDFYRRFRDGPGNSGDPFLGMVSLRDQGFLVTSNENWGIFRGHGGLFKSPGTSYKIKTCPQVWSGSWCVFVV